MADNELTVLDATGTSRTLRSLDVGGKQAQGAMVWEGPEVLSNTTGSVPRFTVTSAAAVALDPPDAGARYARVRVYETSGNTLLRLFYRQDGVAVTGVSDATGFLLHGEMFLVKIADFTQMRLVAESSATFQVFVEWLANA